MVVLALEIGYILSPLGCQLVEDWLWYGKAWGTSVDNGWVLLTVVLNESFVSISHFLTFKCPSLKLILIILKDLESLRAIDDLSWVKTSKDGIWPLLHIGLRDAEADHGSINQAILFEWPQKMLLLFVHVLPGWKTEESIEPLVKTNSLVESYELERGAFTVLHFHLSLDETGLLDFRIDALTNWLEASEVLVVEALELGWTIANFLGIVIEDLRWVGLGHMVALCEASALSFVLWSGNHWAFIWVILLELKLSWSCSVVTHGARDSKIFRACIKHQLHWLTHRRAQIQRSQINSILKRLQSYVLCWLIFGIQELLLLLSDHLLSLALHKTLLFHFLIIDAKTILNNLNKRSKNVRLFSLQVHAVSFLLKEF